MKIQFLTGFLLTGLVCLPLDFISQPHALAVKQPVATATNSSLAQYKESMRLGYRLTGRRNYRPALQKFQEALQIRPGDRYASVAIKNVNIYIQRRNPLAYNGMGKPNAHSISATRGRTPFALIPPDGKTPRTTSANPSFYINITEDYIGTPLKFVLHNGDGNQKALYQTEIKPVEKAGIVKVTIPVNNPALKTGKEYTWTLSTPEVAGNPSETLYQNKIQRVQDETLLEEIQQTPQPLDQVSIYATAEYWENALTILADLRRQNPNDPQLQEYWQKFLTSVKLEHIADKPLL